MSGVDEIDTGPSDRPDLASLPVRDDQELMLEGRDYDIRHTPVNEDDFLGYSQDGSMVLVKNSPGPTDQDYDAFLDAFEEEFGLEFGAYLTREDNGRRDTVSMEELDEAVSHLDPNYTVREIKTGEGSYIGIKQA